MSDHNDVPERATAEVNAGKACDACPLATDRRGFLRDMAIAVVAAVAVAGLAPGAAFARSVHAISPLASTAVRRRYELPRTDGVSIDDENEVILARWQNRIYAFSLRCPHRGTRLTWHADESRVFCPKHKARFRPDGAHDSGRRSRALDRYDLRLEGSDVVVDLGSLHRVDEDPDGWNAAVLSVG
ncbi:MAG TPA: Rieske (2Fe-2S) protein [Gemmatimonadaceae bacterium]|nr:Rieske (2Fe-2S) protein [Gemmatimonadaceae bacterium]